jgi:hypothetical protein
MLEGVLGLRLYHVLEYNAEASEDLLRTCHAFMTFDTVLCWGVMDRW